MYEPIVVLSHGFVLWRTSLAQDEPMPEDVVMHEKCAPVPSDQEGSE